MRGCYEGNWWALEERNYRFDLDVDFVCNGYSQYLARKV